MRQQLKQRSWVRVAAALAVLSVCVSACESTKPDADEAPVPDSAYIEQTESQTTWDISS